MIWFQRLSAGSINTYFEFLTVLINLEYSVCPVRCLFDCKDAAIFLFRILENNFDTQDRGQNLNFRSFQFLFPFLSTLVLGFIQIFVMQF